MTSQSSPTEVVLQRATALYDLGRYQTAVPLLQTVVADDPHNQAAICRLAYSLLALGRSRDGMHWARVAIENAPDNDWGYRLACIALTQLGQLSEAVAAARSAVRVAPFEPSAVRILAQALIATGELVEAREVADRAVQLDPLDAHGYLVVGAVATQQGRLDDASTAYRACLRIEPDNSAAHNDLARLQLKNPRVGLTGLAIAADGFATSARADPRSGVGRRNLDIVLHAFLGQVTYAVFLAAFVGARLDSNQAWARALPLVAVLVPVLIAAQFVRKLSPNLRRYLRQLMRRPVTGAAVVCDGVALAGIVYATFSADHSSAAYLAAVAAAVLARLILWVYRRLRFGERSQLFNRTSLLVMLAFLLLFTATILIIAGTIITFVVAAACVVASIYTSAVIYRRVRQR